MSAARRADRSPSPPLNPNLFLLSVPLFLLPPSPRQPPRFARLPSPSSPLFPSSRVSSARLAARKPSLFFSPCFFRSLLSRRACRVRSERREAHSPFPPLNLNLFSSFCPLVLIAPLHLGSRLVARACPPPPLPPSTTQLFFSQRKETENIHARSKNIPRAQRGAKRSTRQAQLLKCEKRERGEWVGGQEGAQTNQSK